MKLKRSKLVYGICRGVTDKFVSSMFDISVEGANEIPKYGAAIVASKHQSNWDIPAQGWVFNNYVGRSANWIMKSSMSSLFDYTGAVRAHQRKKVVRALMGFARDRKKYEKMFARVSEEFDYSRAQDLIGCALIDVNAAEVEFNEFNKKMVGYVSWLYSQDEMVVFDPEGTRNLGKMGDIDMPLIEHACDMSVLYGQEIPLILMGMNYENIKKRGSRLDIKIERMGWNNSNLKGAIRSGLERLSGL